MTDREVIDQFVAMFRGRGDCYGHAKGFCVHKPLTHEVFARHLTSMNPDDHIGVYCMVGEMASWGCIDIDGHDFPLTEPNDYGVPINIGHDWTGMYTLAQNLKAVLAAKHIPVHIEMTKNGYHCWVFPSVPLVPAAHMRRALMAACVAIGYNPKEVNPKAEGPRAGTKGLGNFVRLPYGGALCPEWAPLARYMYDDGPLYLHKWLDSLETYDDEDGPRYGYASPENLEAVSRLWTPPPVAHHEIDYEAGLDVEPILRHLDGRAYTVWRDGPLEGSDRSNTLARLAYMCAERGLTATQAYAVVRSADQRWGKFAHRADGPEQLARFIEKAYA